MYDSLEEWPQIELQDVSEPMTRFHPGETEVVVRVSERHSVSFFLNDLDLDDLLLKIVDRQRIRAIQNVVTISPKM